MKQWKSLIQEIKINRKKVNIKIYALIGFD